jgi:DNA helicase-2/ATP-dependent DNA helicase PcrA
VSFRGFADEVAEAASVAQDVAAAIASGVSPREVAILFRINAQSETFEEALAERSVPYVVRGSERFFERSEVRQALTLLRGAARTEASSTGDLVRDVTDVLAAMGWTPEPPPARGNVRDRWESLHALLAMAHDHAAAEPAAEIGGFVAELQRRAEAQHAPVSDGVTLATLHAAKGLEWSRVHLTGVQEGSLPIVYAETDAQIAEERRLLYVGMTRAQDELHVSWAGARSPGGRGQRPPSRFLDALASPRDRAPASTGRSARTRRTTRMTHCRVCARPLTDARERKLGRCGDCPATYDEQLFDALRSWRKERAAAEKLPAYCVFTDATLTALAEMRPQDVAGLIAVPGIGSAKVDKYGADVLALCGAGSSAPDPAAAEDSATFRKLHR